MSREANIYLRKYKVVFPQKGLYCCKYVTCYKFWNLLIEIELHEKFTVSRERLNTKVPLGTSKFIVFFITRNPVFISGSAIKFYWWIPSSKWYTKCDSVWKLLGFIKLRYLEICYKYRIRACHEKICFISSIKLRGTDGEDCHFSANNREKGKVQVVYCKIPQVEAKLTSSHVSMGNVWFCSNLFLWKFINKFYYLFWNAAPAPNYLHSMQERETANQDRLKSTLKRLSFFVDNASVIIRRHLLLIMIGTFVLD